MARRASGWLTWPVGRWFPASLHPASLLPCIPATLHPASLPPCFPLPASCYPPCARLASLSPEARSCAAAAGCGGGWCTLVGMVGYTPGYAPGHTQGCTTTCPPGTPPPAAPPRRAGTGLWAQACSQGPGGSRRKPASPAVLLYLRPFSPGQRNRPKAVLMNDWIGSRSSRP